MSNGTANPSSPSPSTSSATQPSVLVTSADSPPPSSLDLRPSPGQLRPVTKGYAAAVTAGSGPAVSASLAGTSPTAKALGSLSSPSPLAVSAPPASTTVLSQLAGANLASSSSDPTAITVLARPPDTTCSPPAASSSGPFIPPTGPKSFLAAAQLAQSRPPTQSAPRSPPVLTSPNVRAVDLGEGTSSANGSAVAMVGIDTYYDGIIWAAMKEPERGRDREFLFQLEAELERFVKGKHEADSARLTLPSFPSLNTYQRRLVHRLCDVWQIPRRAESIPTGVAMPGPMVGPFGGPSAAYASNTILVLMRSQASSAPASRLSDVLAAVARFAPPSSTPSDEPRLAIQSVPVPSSIDADDALPAPTIAADRPIRIMSRARATGHKDSDPDRIPGSSSTSSATASSAASEAGSEGPSGKKVMTYEERTARYNEARTRIFATEQAKSGAEVVKKAKSPTGSIKSPTSSERGTSSSSSESSRDTDVDDKIAAKIAAMELQASTSSTSPSGSGRSIGSRSQPRPPAMVTTFGPPPPPPNQLQQQWQAHPSVYPYPPQQSRHIAPNWAPGPWHPQQYEQHPSGLAGPPQGYGPMSAPPSGHVSPLPAWAHQQQFAPYPPSAPSPTPSSTSGSSFFPPPSTAVSVAGSGCASPSTYAGSSRNQSHSSLSRPSEDAPLGPRPRPSISSLSSCSSRTASSGNLRASSIAGSVSDSPSAAQAIRPAARAVQGQTERPLSTSSAASLAGKTEATSSTSISGSRGSAGSGSAAQSVVTSAPTSVGSNSSEEGEEMVESRVDEDEVREEEEDVKNKAGRRRTLRASTNPAISTATRSSLSPTDNQSSPTTPLMHPLPAKPDWPGSLPAPLKKVKSAGGSSASGSTHGRSGSETSRRGSEVSLPMHSSASSSSSSVSGSQVDSTVGASQVVASPERMYAGPPFEGRHPAQQHQLPPQTGYWPQQQQWQPPPPGSVPIGAWQASAPPFYPTSQQPYHVYPHQSQNTYYPTQYPPQFYSQQAPQQHQQQYQNYAPAQLMVQAHQQHTNRTYDGDYDPEFEVRRPMTKSMPLFDPSRPKAAGGSGSGNEVKKVQGRN